MKTPRPSSLLKVKGRQLESVGRCTCAIIIFTSLSLSSSLSPSLWLLLSLSLLSSLLSRCLCRHHCRHRCRHHCRYHCRCHCCHLCGLCHHLCGHHCHHLCCPKKLCDISYFTSACTSQWQTSPHSCLWGDSWFFHPKMWQHWQSPVCDEIHDLSTQNVTTLTNQPVLVLSRNMKFYNSRIS